MQVAFLRCPFADTLFKSLIYVGWDIDLQAPQVVADLINNSLKTHSLIVEFYQWCNALSKAIKELYRTLKIAQAVGSEEYKLYTQAASDLENHKKTLKREKQKETQLDFF